MATIQELLQECMETSNGQTKTASVAKPATDEIDSVLAELGIADAETVKTASDVGENTNGGMKMSLADIYNQITEEAPASEGQTKVANEEGSESDFGSLTGHYVNILMNEFIEGIDKEANEKPMAHAGDKSSLSATMGNGGDPALEMNHSASSGKGMNVSTGGKSPYDLNAAMIKAVLKRRVSAEAGDVGGYHQG